MPASIWLVRTGGDGHSHPICRWGRAPSAAPPRPTVTLVEGGEHISTGEGLPAPRQQAHNLKAKQPLPVPGAEHPQQHFKTPSPPPCVPTPQRGSLSELLLGISP